MPDDILTLDAILKADTKPTDVTLSGNLTPQQARTFIKAIVDRQSILKDVTVDTTSKLTKERSTYDIAKGVLNRHVSGTPVPAAAMKKLGKIGCTLDMTKGVSLNARILQDTINDNKDNPDFEKEQFENFAIAFMNDLDYLGIAGTADNASADAPFTELAKGWVQIAKDSAAVVTVTTSAQTITERLIYLVKNLHEDIKGGKAEIILSAVDYDDYQLEVADKYPTSGALVNGGMNTFMGYKLKANSNMDAGEYLATIPKNMVFGISNQIERNRWYDNESSCLRYKFVVYPDYEFDIHKYVTYMTVGVFELTALTASVVKDATTTITVTSAAGAGLAGVTAITNNSTIATATYNSETGAITITGVAEGTAIITVSDGTSSKEISVTVTAA